MDLGRNGCTAVVTGGGRGVGVAIVEEPDEGAFAVGGMVNTW